VQNEEDLHRDGSAHDVTYSKVFPPNVQVISPAEIVGIAFSKTTFEDEGSKQLITQTCTTHRDTEMLLRATVHSGLRVFILPSADRLKQCNQRMPMSQLL